ncbi:hypothetical protein M0804_014989 [Polistes exclamans]|nr:hypothetical protein M0804_014989 [Polistes exclamans]
MEDWRKHFMGKLGEKDNKGAGQKETKREEACQHTEDQEELSREEFVRQVNRLKKGKLPGEDKLENEVCKYMPKEEGIALWEILRNIWEKGRNIGAVEKKRDLKKAFDRVDREVLKERMMEIGVVGDVESKEFWKEEEVRQSCPLSPILFNIYQADLKEELEKGQIGGCRIWKKKVWCIAYSDDIVLIADREEELKEILRSFKKYFEFKKMILSEAKTKILENGKNDKHMEERKRKAVIAIKYACSIGERIFKKSYRRRRKLFRALVESVALFGAEIWGWEKDGRLESVQKINME